MTRDRRAVTRLLRGNYPIPRRARVELVAKIIRTTNAVRGYHTMTELLTVVEAIFARASSAPPTVVECGVGSGASTAKLSLAVEMVAGRLVAFDSFQGIPENDEVHRLLDGTELRFRRGAFRGRLEAVQRRLKSYGAPEVCELHKGLFENTLPALEGRVDIALLDVDLLASTESCLRALAPRMRPGGVIFSQDGHLLRIVERIEARDFWLELGVTPRRVVGLRRQKLLEIHF